MPFRTPHFFVDDFAARAAKADVPLTDEARRLVLAIETTAERADTWLDRSLILAILIREVQPLRRVLMLHGLDPVLASDLAENEVLRFKGDKYHDIDSDLYSADDGVGNRSAIGGTAVARARSDKRNSLSPLHIVAAFLDAHDSDTPPQENGGWTDEGLHVPFNTLSHVLGVKRQELWLPFDTVRKELGLLTPEAMRREPIEGAPSHVRNGLLSFFADNPDYSKNCFLIMPFRETNQMREVQSAVRSVLADSRFCVLRADDRIYSENVFTNIEVFMHGCRFAVSVIERMASEQHNANVALEVGYMLGLKKDVCLLKERTVASLPSDLQGRLYTEFDMFSVTETVRTSLEKWLKDRRIVGGHRDG